jgi:hypothetical protein
MVCFHPAMKLPRIDQENHGWNHRETQNISTNLSIKIGKQEAKSKSRILMMHTISGA